MNYIAVVHKDKDTGYGISFPEVGGCTAVCDTLDGVLAEAEEALALYMETLVDLGKPFPEPKGLDFVLKNTTRQGLVTTAVIPVIENDKTVRINITIPERQLQLIDAAAKKQNLSRSAFMTETALKAIKK